MQARIKPEQCTVVADLCDINKLKLIFQKVLSYLKPPPGDICGFQETCYKETKQNQTSLDKS